jgi:hypothetical protein
MPLLVVLAVSVVVFMYVRFTRLSRQAWLTKLDLPGRWRRQTGDEAAEEVEQELLLQGKKDRGEFVLTDGNGVWRGQWQLIGHTLHLRGAGRQRALDLHYFKPGNIGLENETGVRELYSKATTNVVPLRSKSGPVSRRQL